MALRLPTSLAEQRDEPAMSNWIGALPGNLDALKARWSLQVSAPFQPGGRTAWVAPAHSARFGDVVLKVAYRHFEAFDEANGLRHWGGEGTVRLFDAVDVDASTTALLLERCRPGTALSSVPEGVQDRVLAGLLRRLWKPPPFATPFRPLQQMCDQWADECEQRFRERPPEADPEIVRAGIALFRSLPRGAREPVLLCTDLHAGNVLVAEREPWLMIDPKPYVGDPTYDVLQHLLNCGERLAADPLGLARHMAGLLDLDPGRLTRWLFARCVVGAPESPELLAVAQRIASARPCWVRTALEQ